MKFNYLVLFICMTSMTYAMEKSNGNGYTRATKQDIDSLHKKLEEQGTLLKNVGVQLKELKAQQEEMKSSVNSFTPQLEILLKNLQIKDNLPVKDKQESEHWIDDTDNKSENKILYLTGGFLIGCLPWLVGRVLLTK